MHTCRREPSDRVCQCAGGRNDIDAYSVLNDTVQDAESSLAAAQKRLELVRRRDGSSAREHNTRRLHTILPPELLLHVARYVVADNPRAAPKLAAICTAFRDIIHSTPDLWQRIYITQRDTDPAEIVHAYVQRSAQRHLDISLRIFAVDDPATPGYDDSERDIGNLYERLTEARESLRGRSHPSPDEWPPALETLLNELHAFKSRAITVAEWDSSLARAVDIIFNQFHRCIRFEFLSTRRRPTELIADRIRETSAPKLRDLVLHVDPSCRLPPVAPRDAPMLASADVQGVLVSPVPPFRLVLPFISQGPSHTPPSGLRQLRLVNGTFEAPATPLTSILSLLGANPELEELSLQPNIPLPAPSTTHACANISLPHLSRLRLTHNVRLERLMQILQLPALTELTLSLQAGSRPAPLRTIFQGQPYPKLQMLHLNNIFVHAASTDLVTALRHLNTLRKLVISDSILSENVLRTLSDPECCPALEELLFEKCEGITEEGILGIWNARESHQLGRSPGSRRIELCRSSSTSSTSSGDTELGTGLRLLVVRNSSAPLADIQFGESH
ncbi:F-box-like protein [Rhizoctonia solani]|uniref:F-box-like protein n=1 Tax=Rhizoctonia solani TaxID=456999 RepID=A0A8H8NPW6_9AGAM|nr:F-box-like protein [Rhizoctonia solani]QRW16223.1 F-box-like protein [Rhizoctonia solani]